MRLFSTADEGWIRVSGAVSKLVAYQLALELVQLIAHTRIADAHLRQQAGKSAQQ